MTKRQEALQQLRVDGWYVLEEVIPASRIDAIRESGEHSTAAHRNPNAPEELDMFPDLFASINLLRPISPIRG